MNETEQTKTYLNMLFRPGEVFEIRAKEHGQKGSKQSWLSYEKRNLFVTTHIPIHESHKRHIWVGVTPRERIGSTTPKHGRVLWLDMDDITLDEAQAQLSESDLPYPTMIVSSGNGVHFYWKLDTEYSADELRPHAKAVHTIMPGDNTHDPTRVMRVPGTKNFKDPDNPKECVIVEYDENRIYKLSQFPKEQVSSGRNADLEPNQRISRPLAEEDFELFVMNWLDGQKHHMAVGVAGYLRKILYYDKTSCLNTIRDIHESAGYEWPDENLAKVVDDTYARPFVSVAGTSKLREFGVIPSYTDPFTYKFKRPPSPKVSIINFADEIAPQEFWMDGLVGPGMLTLWAAEPKTGKSFAAMQMGYALSRGENLWGFDVPRAHRVLYFQGELSQGMVAQRALSVFGKRALQMPERFALTDKPKELIDLVSHPEVLNDLAENFDVIIVDPISAFNANDENSSATVRETLGIFDTLKSKGKAVILVHHTKKLQADRQGNPITPSFSDIRGSGAWFAAADALALQYRTGDVGNTKVKFMFRAAPERDPITLYRRQNGSFTDDYHEYLAEQGGTVRIPTSKLN